jgi:putative membrane protein
VYLWTKTLHTLFVIAWMACVFYLPRILVNLAEVGPEPAVRARLVLMGRRLYRFGHVMFGALLLFGLLLWFGWRLWPEAYPHITAGRGWMHAKALLVAALFAYFLHSGRWLRRAAEGGDLPDSKWLRIYNEAPVLLTVAVLYLVIAKPI